MSTQEHEAAAEKLAQRIMEEACDFDMMVKGCVCLDSAGPDDGPCDYCVIKAKAQTILAAALADAVRVAREEEREACALVVETFCENRDRLKFLPAVNLNDGRDQLRWYANAIRQRTGEGDATAKPREIVVESGCCAACYQLVGQCVCDKPREGDATPGPSQAQQAYDEQLDGHIRNGSWEPATPGPEPDDENLRTRNRADATPPKKGRPRKKCEDCWCHPSIKNFERQVHCEDCAPPSEER